jgi:hypothetical protein
MASAYYSRSTPLLSQWLSRWSLQALTLGLRAWNVLVDRLPM